MQIQMDNRRDTRSEVEPDIEEAASEAKDAVFFDPGLFLLHFIYVILFPLSLLVQVLLRLCSQRLAFEAKLTWGACVPYAAFWVYFAFFLGGDHGNLAETEIAAVAVLLILIALDTAAACANPHLKRLFRLSDLWQSLFWTKGQGNRVASTFSAMQAVYVAPHSVANIAARKALRDSKISLPVPSIASLDKFAYLDYDVASLADHISASSSVDHSPSHAEVVMPESYVNQVKKVGSVSIDALADTLIWGVRPRGFGACGGFLSRFLSPKKMPAALLSVGYTGLIAALPTLIRYSKFNIKPSDLNTTEAGLTIGYILLTLVLATQVMAFWAFLSEAFETQYTRMYSLSLLLDPVASRLASLPVLDFKNPQHVAAWGMLYRYVSGFSSTTLEFFGRRLIIFGTGLAACIAYIVGQVIYRNITSEAFFGAFTIISFFVFGAFFVIVLIFGLLTNGYIDKFRASFAALELECQLSTEVHDDDAKADAVLRNAARFHHLLWTYFHDASKVAIFGVVLDTGFASALATALVTGAGYLVPVFVKIFESEPGT